MQKRGSKQFFLYLCHKKKEEREEKEQNVNSHNIVSLFLVEINYI